MITRCWIESENGKRTLHFVNFLQLKPMSNVECVYTIHFVIMLCDLLRDSEAISEAKVAKCDARCLHHYCVRVTNDRAHFSVPSSPVPSSGVPSVAESGWTEEQLQ